MGLQFVRLTYRVLFVPNSSSRDRAFRFTWTKIDVPERERERKSRVRKGGRERTKKREQVYIQQMETREVLRARKGGMSSCRYTVGRVYDGPMGLVGGPR